MLLSEIGAYLAGQSVSVPFNTTLVRATNLFEGEDPPLPDVLVALLEYPGPDPEHDMGHGVTRVEFSRFQMIVRHTSFSTGRLLIQQCKESLVAVCNQALTGVGYLTVDAVGSNPFSVPRDENRRWVWKWSFEAWKAPSVS